MIDEQVCGIGSCSCFSGATVCDSCYHGSDFKMTSDMFPIERFRRAWHQKNQENLVALVSGLGVTTTCGQSNCTESPSKLHRCGCWVVITLKILMPLGLLRNEMIKKMIDFQGRGTTFLSWKCSFSYQEMIANSESCPYDTSSQLVTFTSMKNFLAFMTHPPSW